MPRTLSWTRTLYVKLGGAVLLLLTVSLLLVGGNMAALRSLEAEQDAAVYIGNGRSTSYRVLYVANRMFSTAREERAGIVSELREVIEDFERRLNVQLDGEQELDIRPESDPVILANLKERRELWRNRIRPVLDRLADAPSREAASDDLELLDRLLRDYADAIEHAVSLEEARVGNTVDRLALAQAAFGAIALLILTLVFWSVSKVSRRARMLAETADRIATGDLGVQAQVSGNDELATVGSAFNTMTESLKRTIEAERDGRKRLEELLETVAETANSLASATSEILAGTTQQAAGAQEQAAAVAQTVTTVNEVHQTSEQAAERAKAVAETAQRSAEIGKTGRKAVDDAAIAIGTIKEQAGEIAESILGLAEQAQAIGEIIAAVNEIAEQTNLLALNASIEATRAGEHGKGFSVVAGEVKALADQSKKATSQVRQILGEIQRATHDAVMATERGTKSVDEATKVVGSAGDTIKALADTIAEAARAASQISASAGQQATGIAQIHQAMKSIDQVTNQNIASTRQAERAAHDLNGLGVKLKSLLEAPGL